MSETIQINAVLPKAIKKKDGTTGLKYALTLADGRTADSWDNPAAWGWTGAPGFAVSGMLINKPYVSKRTGLAENSWQFTADAVAVAPPAAAPPVPPPPVGTPGAVIPPPGPPSAVKDAFARMADKDRTIARESILSSVAVMLPILARPRDQKDEPRGWTPADVIAAAEIFERYVYRTNGSAT